jgi:hypothetical protein
MLHHLAKRECPKSPSRGNTVFTSMRNKSRLESKRVRLCPKVVRFRPFIRALLQSQSLVARIPRKGDPEPRQKEAALIVAQIRCCLSGKKS